MFVDGRFTRENETVDSGKVIKDLILISSGGVTILILETLSPPLTLYVSRVFNPKL
jgi:hypothetical protein